MQLKRQIVLTLTLAGLCAAIPTAADPGVIVRREDDKVPFADAKGAPKDMPFGAFTWSGPLVPGGPATSFEANSAEEVYNRLKEMIPGYDAAMFGVSSKRDVSDNEAYGALDRLKTRNNYVKSPTLQG
jgi:hypothetical protein